MSATEIKKQLHARCVAIVQQRIADSRQAMDAAQESANQEEKSSMGDKYETGRAMAQIARDQAAQQLDEALKLKLVLDQINPMSSSTNIGLGSLVVTDQNQFYIAISVGRLEIDGKEHFVVSPQSPIGKLLINRKVNDSFVFNKQTQIVRAIL